MKPIIESEETDIKFQFTGWGWEYLRLERARLRHPEIGRGNVFFGIKILRWKVWFCDVAVEAYPHKRRPAVVRESHGNGSDE